MPNGTAATPPVPSVRTPGNGNTDLSAGGAPDQPTSCAAVALKFGDGNASSVDEPCDPPRPPRPAPAGAKVVSTRTRCGCETSKLSGTNAPPFKFTSASMRNMSWPASTNE